MGAGPNGLAAAIRMARAGYSVHLIEANSQLGGGVRSVESTLPGFIHDRCSAIHPLAVGSPFFRSLPLERFGLQWVHPPYPLAHPLDNGEAAVLGRSLDGTAERLGTDARSYRWLLEPLVEHWKELADELLRPLLRWPRRPWLKARFGLRGFMPASLLARTCFGTEKARALLAGLAAHSMLPLDAPVSSSFGLILGAAGHAVGWPFPRAGAQQLTNALARYLASLGGTVTTETRITALDEIPRADIVLLDLSIPQIEQLFADRLPRSYRRKLRRYRHGPAVFKVDYALDGPIPWEARACKRAGTIHLGGTFAEIAAAEKGVARGNHARRPFVLLAQHSLFDDDRAPQGKHTAWAYCHVPLGSSVDMTDAIDRQIERYAPGFRDRVLARNVTAPADLQASNPNLYRGDINGGTAGLRQLIARPVFSPTPYRLPVDGYYLCSAATPPGGGVHGMCGYHAAEAALEE